MTEHRQIERLTELTKGTSKVIFTTKDPEMAKALNYAVDAIRELQGVVFDLQERVDQLENER